MSIKAETTFALKDQLFNEVTSRQLGEHVAAVYKSFNVEQFVQQAIERFPQLELKARISCLVDCLARQLPKDVHDAQQVLLAALPPPLDASKSDDDFGEFIWVVPGEYVARFGCQATSVDTSLLFLSEATKRFSSEFALRPFLHQFPEATLGYVRQWTEDDNYHVRRLASEGTRPFLPWGQRVVLPVGDLVDILSRLHADPTRYVTRSVANSLNDLTKLDSVAALQLIEQWRSIQQQASQELEWMTRHGLRTLLKEDDKQALSLCGYPTEPQFSLSNEQVSQTVAVGEALEWSAVLKSKIHQRLRISLRLHFLKNSGRHSVKVFAIKDVDVAPGEEIKLAKRLPFRPMTTRALYPGRHYVELVVNGVKRKKHAFELTR